MSFVFKGFITYNKKKPYLRFKSTGRSDTEGKKQHCNAICIHINKKTSIRPNLWGPTTPQ